ncbi:MAG TPA: hypothetical protein VGF84_02025 [Micromonosporaceae bacterium]
MRHDVISHQQAILAGMTRSTVEAHVKAGRWQRLYRGIYVTHSGPVPRMTRIVAVLTAAGPGAALSHSTAAELSGLSDATTSTVHVTVSNNRRIAKLNGARIHYSEHLDARRHPTRWPAQTRIEETVLDLADGAYAEAEVIQWLVAACARRLTTPGRIATALNGRKRIRWRRELTHALGDVAVGNHSILELRYFRRVERAHRLPAGNRQAPHQRPGGRIYDDVHYAAFKTVVELDGRVAHSAETTLRDLRRDNIASIRGDAVLHFGWADVAETPCATAVQVATVPATRGWTGSVRRCGPNCMIRER